MTRRHIISLAAVAALLAGCGGGLSIRTDFDPQTSFAGFNTYSWAERTESGDDDPRVYNAITAGQVRNAVNTALQAKGIRETSSNPDFRIAWHGAIEGKMDFRTISDHYGYDWGGYYTGFGIGTSTARTTQREWDEGTLIIDIVRTRTHELVWRGPAQAKLDERQPTGETAQRQMNEAAAGILETFPPGSGS